MKLSEFRQIIREEVRYGLKNESVLKEAFASPILRNLLTRELNPNHRNTTTIAGAFQKMAKIALDKVPDSAVTKMNPMEAYRKSSNPDVVVFYISEKGGTNPYSKEDIYSKIEPNSLLAIASGDKKFYDIDFNYKTWKNDKPTLIRKNLPGEKRSFSHGGDSIGIRKQSYSKGGYGAPTTGLNTVKRIADVADVAYVIDLTAVRAQYGLKNESVVNEANMKKSEFRKLIREEVRTVLNEKRRVRTLKERKETGLTFTTRGPVDATKMRDALDDSDLHYEWNAREGYFFFPEEEDNYDELELEIQKIADKIRVNGHIEGIW